MPFLWSKEPKKKNVFIRVLCRLQIYIIVIGRERILRRLQFFGLFKLLLRQPDGVSGCGFQVMGFTLTC